MLAILNIFALYNTACFLCPLGYQYHHPSKMSNSHPLRPYTAVGEIDHVHILSEHIGALMNGEEYSDVTFIVEKKRFPAHRVILAARCHYFRWSKAFCQAHRKFLCRWDKYCFSMNFSGCNHLSIECDLFCVNVSQHIKSLCSNRKR